MGQGLDWRTQFEIDQWLPLRATCQDCGADVLARATIGRSESRAEPCTAPSDLIKSSELSDRQNYDTTTSSVSQ